MFFIKSRYNIKYQVLDKQHYLCTGLSQPGIINTDWPPNKQFQEQTIKMNTQI